MAANSYPLEFSKVQKDLLKDDVPFIHFSRPESDISVLSLWSKAGSSADAPGKEGTAHFLEHMLFKGIAGGGQAFNVDMEKAGAFANAHTSPQHTAFEVLFPSDQIQRVVPRFMGLFQDIDFDQDFQAEKNVIREEILEYQDQVMSRFNDAVLETFWGPKHPLSHPVLGDLSSVDSITSSDLSKFMDAHHVSSKIAFCFAGPPEAVAEVKRCCDAFLSSRSGRNPNEGVPQAPDRLAKAHFYHMKSDANHVLSYLYHLPKLSPRQGAALEVLDQLISGQEHSTYKRALVDESKIATSIHSGLLEYRESGVYYLDVVLKDDAFDVASNTLATLNASSMLSVREKDIRETVEKIEADIAWEDQSIETWIGRMGHGWIYQDDIMSHFAHRHALKDITLQDVRDMSDLIFGKSADLVATLGQKKPSVKKLSMVPKTPTSFVSGKRQRSTEKEIQKDGLNAVFLPSSTGFSSFHLMFRGGRFVEVSPQTRGCFQLMAKVLEAFDHTHLSSQAFSRVFQSLQADVDATPGRTHFSTEMVVPNTNAAEAWPFFISWITDINIRQNVFDKTIDMLKALALAMCEDPGNRFQDESLRKLYGDTYLGRTFLRDFGAEASLSMAELEPLFKASMNVDNARLVVQAPERLWKQIEGGLYELCGPLGRGKPHLAPDKVGMSQGGDLPLQGSSEKAYGELYFPAPSVRSDRRYLAEMLSQMLGAGASSHLYNRVREDLGLVYGIDANYEASVSQGHILIQWNTQKNQAQDARNAVLQALDDFRSEKVDKDLMNRCKALYRTQKLMEKENPTVEPSQRCFADLWEISWSPSQDLEALLAITDRDLFDFAQSTLREDQGRLFMSA